MDAVDQIAFLAGSQARVAVLATLSREGGLAKGELVERVDAARVTVNRNLEQLEDHGLVESRDGRWRLTPLGELLAGDFLSLAETVESADHLAPVLRRLPPGEFDLDPDALVGAEVTESTKANPYAPVERHGEVLLGADRARMLLPAVSPTLMADTMEPIRDGALVMEIVVAPSVAETYRTEIPDLVADLRRTGGVDLYEVESGVPFYLGLLDDVVQIGVADEEGIPRALAETDADAVRTWAERTYEDHRSTAGPLDLDPDED